MDYAGHIIGIKPDMTHHLISGEAKLQVIDLRLSDGHTKTQLMV